MPKNIKKFEIIEDIREDVLFQKEIAEKYNVSESYVSQLKNEVKKIDYAKHLRFLYNFMDQYMQPNSEKPSEEYLDKIDKIGGVVDAIKG